MANQSEEYLQGRDLGDENDAMPSEPIEDLDFDLDDEDIAALQDYWAV